MSQLSSARAWLARNTRIFRALLILSAFIAVVAVAAAVRNMATPSLGFPQEASAASPDLQRIDQQVAFWQDASNADSFSATFPANVAALLMQRARLTGDTRDALKAEAEARRSLSLRTQHNGGAFVTLATSLLERHRFEEARDVARQLVAGQPDVDVYHSLLAETQLELGDYDGARASFSAVRASTASSGMLANAARWAELQGYPDEARRLLRTARAMAVTQPEMPPAEIAWFDMREGDLALQQGHPNAAAAAYRRGLALAPNDYRLQAAMGRLAAAQGQWDKAIAYGEASISTVVDPGTLGSIASALEAKGDTARASEFERTMEVVLSGQPGSHHRAWSLYMLDHGRHVSEIVQRAETELRTRKDIYGYDLVAWALHKANRNAEAQTMMASALRLGTRDPLLFYHAGTIAYHVGDDERARKYLSEALELDPVSRPNYTAEARNTLAFIDAKLDPQRSFPNRLVAQSMRAIQRHILH